MIFIDADKGNYLRYFEWSLKLSRTVIIGDNVVSDGAILDPEDYGPAQTMRSSRAYAASTSCSQPSLGLAPPAPCERSALKGCDEFTLAIVDNATAW
jgi:hypothetical protein